MSAALTFAWAFAWAFVWAFAWAFAELGSLRWCDAKGVRGGPTTVECGR